MGWLRGDCVTIFRFMRFVPFIIIFYFILFVFPLIFLSNFKEKTLILPLLFFITSELFLTNNFFFRQILNLSSVIMKL